MRTSSRNAAFGAACSALALTLLIGCESPTSILPGGTVPFTPPSKYRLWWSMVESCSGYSRDFNAVTWHVLPGTVVLPNGANGSYYRGTSQILLAEQASAVPFVVRHEMLHAVLPVGGHPRAVFLGSCGDIVLCDDLHCALEEGGRPAPPTATSPEILPGEVGTRFEITPALPSVTTYGGAWAITISITNPHPYEVWVKLTPELQSPIFWTWGVIFDVGDPSQAAGQATATNNPRFGLAANETRRWVWEQTAHAGPMGVRAFFNVDTAPRVSFTVPQ